MSPSDIGRLTVDQADSGNTVYDAPMATVKAMNTKLDQIITWQNSVGAAIEAATDAASLFTALDTVGIKTVIKKLKFTL